jgi:hypothetical protein
MPSDGISTLQARSFLNDATCVINRGLASSMRLTRIGMGVVTSTAEVLARELHQRAGVADVCIADIDAEVDVFGPPAARGDAEGGLLSQGGVELVNRPPERVSRK